MADIDNEQGGAPSKLPDVGQVAAAVIALISATTAIIGGFTGGVARVARNNTFAIPATTALAFMAALLALLASRRKGRAQTLLLGVSLSVFALAAIWIAIALSSSLATPDRPIVAAKWAESDGRLSLVGTVTASGLRTGDQLTIAATRLINHGDPPPPAHPTASPSGWIAREHVVYPAGIVYQQTAGADIDGNAKIEFSVPLPSGYDGMQVVASTQGYDACPAPASPSPTPTPLTLPTASPSAVPIGPYACLTLDAPEVKPPTTPSATPAPPSRPTTP